MLHPISTTLLLLVAAHGLKSTLHHRQGQAGDETFPGACLVTPPNVTSQPLFGSLVSGGLGNTLRYTPENRVILDDLYDGAPKPSVLLPSKVYGFLNGTNKAALFEDPVPGQPLRLQEMNCEGEIHAFAGGKIDFDLAFPSWPDHAGDISKYRITQSKAPSAAYSILYAGLLGADITRRMENSRANRKSRHKRLGYKKGRLSQWEEAIRVERYIVTTLCSHITKDQSHIVAKAENETRAVILDLPEVWQSPDWAPLPFTLEVAFSDGFYSVDGSSTGLPNASVVQFAVIEGKLTMVDLNCGERGMLGSIRGEDPPDTYHEYFSGSFPEYRALAGFTEFSYSNDNVNAAISWIYTGLVNMKTSLMKEKKEEPRTNLNANQLLAGILCKYP